MRRFSLAKGPTRGMTLHSAPMDNNLMASLLLKRESAQRRKSHATYLCLTSLNNVTVVTLTVQFYGPMRFIQSQTGTNHGLFERWDRKITNEISLVSSTSVFFLLNLCKNLKALLRGPLRKANPINTSIPFDLHLIRLLKLHFLFRSLMYFHYTFGSL